MMLSEEQVQFYHEEGYLILRDVFSKDEINALALNVDQVLVDHADAIDANNLRVRFKPHHETGVQSLEVIDPIADLSPVAKSITQDVRIIEALVCIYGEPACLFKEKLIYKFPGNVGATLHQDWIAWPGFPETFLTVLLAIDEFNDENGATEVYPRLHKRGYLSPKDGQHHCLKLSDMEETPVPLRLNPGDIAIFSCFTPHLSGPNLTEKTRRGYFISYNALSDGGEQYSHHYSEFHDWIRAKYPEPQRHTLYFR